VVTGTSHLLAGWLSLPPFDFYRIALSMLDDREIPQPIEDVDFDGHRVRHAPEGHPVESGDVAWKDEIYGASGDVDLVVGIGLTKPRVRLVGIVAPEHLMIDNLDLLTGLSTLAHPEHYDALYPVYRWETRPNSVARFLPDAVGGYFPWWLAFNHPP
jgi:hypothetical protein